MKAEVDDDSKSMSSQASTLTMNNSKGDAFSKADNLIFTYFYPLYDQPKNPNREWSLTVWFIQMLMLFTLGFFRVETDTKDPTNISKYLNFVDLTSLSFYMIDSLHWIVIGIFIYQVLLIVFLTVTSILYSLIVSTQPWIITVLRWLVQLTYTVLYIPAITIPITIFDCFHDDAGRNLLRTTERSCLAGWDQSVGFVVAVLHLVLFLFTSSAINILVFNHNQKHGGIFASPSGQWQAIRSIFTFGLVFAMRMLVGWRVWRCIVTVGTSLLLVIYFVHMQPCYKLLGNVLNAIPFALFGSMRLFLEIGYRIEDATDSIVPTIVFAVLGFIAGVIACILCNVYARKRRTATLLLTPSGRPLIDMHQDNPASQLPPIKHPERVEPALRFLLNSETRSADHLAFADLVYTHALKKHKTNAALNFHYANFLVVYRKNWVKAQGVYRQARMSSPDFFLRFVLYCKTKEASKNAGAVGSELNSLTFTTLMNKATEQHDAAKDALKDFFDNLTLLKPNFSLLPVHLHQIVSCEAEARKCYEELVSTHPKNTGVLRAYARLLLDIYHDEDTADIILTRADRIEEDSSTVTAGVIPNMPIASSGTGGSGSGSGSGSAGTSAPGVSFGSGPAEGGGKEHEDAALENHPDMAGFDQINAVDGANPHKASGTDLASFSAEESGGYPETRSQAKSVRAARRKKKKKKKGGNEITDLTLGASSASGDNSGAAMTALIVVFHLLEIASLIAGVVVLAVINSKYKAELATLEMVCRTSTSVARFANLAITMMCHDIEYEFKWTPDPDNRSNTLLSFTELKEQLKQETDSISNIVSNINGLTDVQAPWTGEVVNIYLYTTAPDQVPVLNDTNNHTGFKILRYDHNKMSLIEALSQMTSAGLNLQNMKDDPKAEKYPQYYADCMFIITNTLQPIIEQSKVTMTSFLEQTDKQNANSRNLYIIITVITLSLSLLVFSIIFVYYTRLSVVERLNSYYKLLDVPKNRLQAVIRRILNSEKDDQGDSTIVQTSTVEGDLGMEAGWANKAEHNDVAADDADNADVMEFAGADDGASRMTPEGTQHDSMQQADDHANPAEGHPAADDQLNNQAMLGSQMGGIGMLNMPGMLDGQLVGAGMLGSPMGGAGMLGSPMAGAGMLGSPMGGMGMLGSPMGGTMAGMGGMNGMGSMAMNGSLMAGSPMGMPLLSPGLPAPTPQDAAPEAKTEKKEEKKAAPAPVVHAHANLNYYDDDADEAQLEAQQGFLRNAVEDTKWEEKFEEEIAKLNAAYKSLPKPITPFLIFTILLPIGAIVVALVVLLVLCIYTSDKSEEVSRNIVLSGIRSTILMQIQYMITRICWNVKFLYPDPPPVFPRSQNPVWSDASHLTDNRTDLKGKLLRLSAYFQQLHSNTHYGVSPYSVTGDKTFDVFNVARLSSQQNTEILLKPAECYASEGTSCSQLDYNRLYGVNGTIYGLAALVSRMRLDIMRVSNMTDSKFNFKRPEFRFISSAIRNDLRKGIELMTEDILQDGQNTVDDGTVLMIILTVVFCLVGLFVMVFGGLNWKNQIVQIRLESTKLLDVIPSDDGEREMAMLPSMRTGYEKMDAGREHLLDTCLQLLDTVRQNEPPASIIAAHKLVMQAAMHQFTEEEYEMERYQATEEHMKAHKHEHLLLRQRLTSIGDYLRQQNRAATSVALRSLLSLFDNHFTSLDLNLGTLILEKEAEAANKEQQEQS